GTSQYSGYCTPKGRLLASLLLWRGTQPSCFAQLPQELLPAIIKRLSMYILRSKVKAADASAASVRMGLAGVQAQALLAAAFGTAPDQPHAVLHHTQASVLALPGGRYEIVAVPEYAAALWSALSKAARPAGAACWDWLEIRAGIATIVPATQEHFVPQMANLDATGAVAFNKGCYPGQEIVARTQYLGKVKRRLYLAHLDVKADAAPQAGDELYSADMEGQASGMVASAAPAPDGGYDVLAVIQVSSAETQPVHWRSLDGPALQLLALPYSLSH
ncbi:MAG: YgfZ/GcvT domain-containing protein, partial [Pseudomonadota bacterium]